MGPSIILDKSAVEAIGKQALHVQSEYFYTVVTPILVWEICGDIEKARQGQCDETKVRALALKAKPFDSIVTTDWRKLCIAELSGLRFEMGTGPSRRAVVDGGHRVPLPQGGYAEVLDEQPEAEALLRWYTGRWTEADVKYAEEWRRVTREIDLEGFKRRFGPARQPVETPEQLKQVVDRVLADASLQYFLLTLLAEEIAPEQALRRKLLRRWTGIRSWPSHARYSRHCIKTFLTFYLALGSGLVGTKATNRVDLEYLLYLPFASVFVSGDERSHGRLAPLLMAEDQAFVRAADFRAALQEQAERVEALRAAVPAPNPDVLEPPESSLIHFLWIKAWGKFRPPPSQRPKPDPERLPKASTLAEEFGKAMDYVNAHPERYPKRPPWPHL
jgi:hypothetical protein